MNKILFLALYILLFSSITLSCSETSQAVSLNTDKMIVSINIQAEMKYDGKIKKIILDKIDEKGLWYTIRDDSESVHSVRSSYLLRVRNETDLHVLINQNTSNFSFSLLWPYRIVVEEKYPLIDMGNLKSQIKNAPMIHLENVKHFSHLIRSEIPYINFLGKNADKGIFIYKMCDLNNCITKLFNTPILFSRKFIMPNSEFLIGSGMINHYIRIKEVQGLKHPLQKMFLLIKTVLIKKLSNNDIVKVILTIFLS